MGFLKPCLDCNKLSRATRCPDCSARRSAYINARKDTPERRARKALLYNKHYNKQAAHIRATAIICHICGKGAKANDPWQADHLAPGQPDSPLLPAHRSCNASRGNKPL